MLSELCRARDEDGSHYADDEITDHMIFVMMAAHDTITVARYHSDDAERTSGLAGAPARRGLCPRYQAPAFEDCAQLEETERAFEEALRTPAGTIYPAPRCT